MAVLLTTHRFTVDDYHAMVCAGVLKEDDRVELIDGEIVDMTPIGLRHAAAVTVLNRAFVVGCGGRAIVQPQGSIQLTEHTEPEPDLAILKPRDDVYRTRAAAPEDVLLVIEVADSSLTYDRTVKLPLYARVRIPEVWLVDLVANRVEVYRQPGAAGYGHIETFERGMRVYPASFPEVAISIVDILG